MKKIFSLFTPLLLPFLLVGSSQTNTDKGSSSALILLSKSELKISISIAPDGQEKSEKTAAVEEGKTAKDAFEEGL